MKLFYRSSSLALAMVVVLVIFGVTSAQFEFRSESMVTGSFENADAANNRLYVANGHGFTIFDVTGNTPDSLGSIRTDGICHDVAYNTFLYVADGLNGFLVCMVVVPTNPQIMGHADNLNGPAKAVSFGDNRAFVAMEGEGIALIDVSAPSTPTVLHQLDTPGRAVDIAYADGYVYVSDRTSVQSYSITNDQFTLVDTETPQTDAYYGLTVVGTTLYVTSGSGGIERFSLANGEMTYVGSTVTANAVDITAFGNNLAVSLQYNGIMVIDPNGAALGVFLNVTEDIKGIATLGDRIFPMEGYRGFEVVDGSVPSSMSVVGDFLVLGGPRNVVQVGDFAYIANHEGGLVIMNVTDPTTPSLAAQVAITGWTYDVVIVGNTAFVCEFYSGLYAINITDPTNPSVIGTYPIAVPGSRALATNGSSYLILVHYTNGISKFDITTPSNIQHLGTATTNGEPRDVDLNVGIDNAYVADYDGGADIYDVSGNTPSLVGSYATTLCRAVGFIDRTLFAGSESGQLDIVDITTPATPALIQDYQAMGDINGLEVGEADMRDKVFLCIWEGGVEAVDVQDPSTPFQDNYFDTHGLGKACFYDITTQNLYLADSYEFYIFHFVGEVKELPHNNLPLTFELQQNFPNPFNPSTNLVFSLDEPGQVTLAVFDINGREVARLFEGYQSAGRYQATFDAANLPSGVYYARLIAEHTSQTCKMLLLK